MEWTYVTKGLEYRKHYSDKCRESRGTKTNLGHMKNYVALGLALAYKAEKKGDPQATEAMENLLGPRVRNGEGKIDLLMARKLEDLVVHCQVTKTKKNSFVNLMGTQTTEGQLFLRLLEAGLAKDGERQWDPPPPKPIHRDLKIALEQARRR